jgi:hypothetical protein
VEVNVDIYKDPSPKSLFVSPSMVTRDEGRVRAKKGKLSWERDKAGMQSYVGRTKKGWVGRLRGYMGASKLGG